MVDLYDQDQSQTYVGIAGIGSYEIMCNAYGWTNDGQYPPYLSPYSKVEAGWLTPIEITTPGYYTLIHLTHEHCRYLNESMCQQEDERHGEARRKRRELREKQRRLVNPDQGKFQILVLLGYFPEDANLVSKNIVPSTTYIDTLYNGDG